MSEDNGHFDRHYAADRPSHGCVLLDRCRGYVAVAVEPAPFLVLFISFAPLTAVCLWLQKEARRTGVGGIQDWGLFLWLFWPLLIPWYAFKTRGLSGWRLAGLLGLACAPYITAYALSWLLYGPWLVREGSTG